MMTSLTAGQVIPRSLNHIIEMSRKKYFSAQIRVRFLLTIKMWKFVVERWSNGIFVSW